MQALEMPSEAEIVNSMTDISIVKLTAIGIRQPNSFEVP
jgi:hypothetical protein